MNVTLPRAVVGVTTLNGPERFRRCLAAIASHTERRSYGLEVVAALATDDGSTEENAELNLRVAASFGFEVLPPTGRRGIAFQWNRLSRHVDADVVALINDDVEVDRDWLDVLAYSVWENQVVGMVSLNCYTNVTRAQAGNRPQRAYHRAHLDDGDGTLLASGGACFAFRRSVFDAVGGFDERYCPAYYEEVDFGVASRQLGFRHYIASHPIVYHIVGATNNDKLNFADADAVLRESRTKFREKWGKTPDELRREFMAQHRDEITLREWNSSLRDLRE